MDKDIFRGLKFSFGFIIGLSLFFSIIYAAGFHPPSDIISGIFTGNYSFTGEVNFSSTTITGLEGLAHGQVRLDYDNGNLSLMPYDGNKIIIGNNYETVPITGINLSNSSLSTDTVYYIYIYKNGSNLQLEANTTNSSLSSNGVRIKSGDSSRTLVGMARTDSNGAWVDQKKKRFVISYFNRKPIYMSTSYTNGLSTTKSNFPLEELSTNMRLEFLTWGDEIVDLTFVGAGTANANRHVYLGVLIDGTFIEGGYSALWVNNVNLFTPVTWNMPYQLSEGYHYSTPGGIIAGGGGTASWGSAVNQAIIQG